MASGSALVTTPELGGCACLELTVPDFAHTHFVPLSLTRLQLHFSGEPGFPRPVCVPEPGMLLLFGAGAGALALYASKRRSSA